MKFLILYIFIVTSRGHPFTNERSDKHKEPLEPQQKKLNFEYDSPKQQLSTNAIENNLENKASIGNKHNADAMFKLWSPFLFIARSDFSFTPDQSSADRQSIEQTNVPAQSFQLFPSFRYIIQMMQNIFRWPATWFMLPTYNKQPTTYLNTYNSETPTNQRPQEEYEPNEELDLVGTDAEEPYQRPANYEEELNLNEETEIRNNDQNRHPYEGEGGMNQELSQSFGESNQNREPGMNGEGRPSYGEQERNQRPPPSGGGNHNEGFEEGEFEQGRAPQPGPPGFNFNEETQEVIGGQGRQPHGPREMNQRPPQSGGGNSNKDPEEGEMEQGRPLQPGGGFNPYEEPEEGMDGQKIPPHGQQEMNQRPPQPGSGINPNEEPDEEIDGQSGKTPVSVFDQDNGAIEDGNEEQREPPHQGPPTRNDGLPQTGDVYISNQGPGSIGENVETPGKYGLQDNIYDSGPYYPIGLDDDMFDSESIQSNTSGKNDLSENDNDSNLNSVNSDSLDESEGLGKDGLTDQTDTKEGMQENEVLEQSEQNSDLPQKVVNSNPNLVNVEADILNSGSDGESGVLGKDGLTDQTDSIRGMERNDMSEESEQNSDFPQEENYSNPNLVNVDADVLNSGSDGGSGVLGKDGLTDETDSNDGMEQSDVSQQNEQKSDLPQEWDGSNPNLVNVDADVLNSGSDDESGVLGKDLTDKDTIDEPKLETHDTFKQNGEISDFQVDNISSYHKDPNNLQEKCNDHNTGENMTYSNEDMSSETPLEDDILDKNNNLNTKPSLTEINEEDSNSNDDLSIKDSGKDNLSEDESELKPEQNLINVDANVLNSESKQSLEQDNDSKIHGKSEDLSADQEKNHSPEDYKTNPRLKGEEQVSSQTDDKFLNEEKDGELKNTPSDSTTLKSENTQKNNEEEKVQFKSKDSDGLLLNLGNDGVKAGVSQNGLESAVKSILDTNLNFVKSEAGSLLNPLINSRRARSIKNKLIRKKSPGNKFITYFRAHFMNKRDLNSLTSSFENELSKVHLRSFGNYIKINKCLIVISIGLIMWVKNNKYRL
uniref:Uncharacterized protein n=1 Tax=Clastoptera arizonana TaxID=38151 RepID=A0A1B6E9Q4_9HEMI